MEQDRFQYLTDAYLRGTLTETEGAEFLAALTESAELRSQLRGQITLEQLLTQRFSERRHPMTRQVMAGLRDPAQKAGVVTRIMRDIGRPEPVRLGASTIHAPIFFPTPRHRNWFIAGASIAAMLVLAATVGTIVMLRSHPGDNSGVVKGPTLEAESIAKVKAVNGNAVVQRNGIPQPLADGAALHALDVLHVSDGAVALDYPDGTLVKILANSSATLHPNELKDSAHIGIALNLGRLEASVKPQPPGKPMMVSTPHARATILGTRFELTVSAGESKLLVTEGAINFASTSRDEAVIVRQNQSAVAAAKMRLDAAPATRDPAYWPFGADSPWNAAVGSGAHFLPIDAPKFDMQRGIELLTGAYGIPVVIGKADDPERVLTNRSPNKTGSLRAHLPSDAKPEPSPLGRLDIIDERHTHVYELLGVQTKPDGSLDVALAFNVPLTGTGVYPSGILHGAHTFGGCALGGLIRRGEAQGGIRHALAGSIPASSLNGNAPSGLPYVWPASHASDDWQKLYGKTGNLHLGTLLAIPPSVDLSRMGLGSSGPAYEIAKALQDYGVYLVDHLEHQDADLKLFCEVGIQDEVPAAVGGRLTAVMGMLQVVVNNSDTSIGGGGSPRRAAPPPFAPEFSAEKPGPKAEKKTDF